ncbi:MAG: hypothetical protein OEV58_01690 [Gammaproteobacteria bacterium]|nr:hypothetical protein [Gammaproteobacteria bacterium]
MITKKHFLTAFLLLVLAACGGGGGSATPSPPAVVPPPPPPPTDELPGGHWFGTLTNDLSAITEDFIAMVDENGRFRFVSVDSAVQMSGNFSVALSVLNGDGTAFADAGVFWLDSTSATPVTIVGTLDGRSTMTGTWTTISGESGSFDFQYDPTFYERASQLDQLAGSWISYDEFLNPEVTFTIAADGSFNGQNTMGCNSLGQFGLINSGFNLFEVQATISGCSLAGDYVGLAFLADILAPNDVMLYAVDNGSRAYLIGFEK